MGLTILEVCALHKLIDVKKPPSDIICQTKYTFKRLRCQFPVFWQTCQLKVIIVVKKVQSCCLTIAADVTPLKGFRADVFCGRDMLNKSSGRYDLLFSISYVI